MELAGCSIEVLMFLFFAAVVAGFLDTLAGGGGLIALPALIISGIPPLFALGTNKLQGTVGTATATIMMLRKRAVRWQDVKYLMLAAFVGSTLGTIVVQFLNTELLNFVIPVVLFCIAVYFLISPQVANPENEAKVSAKNYNRLVVPVIGWYDGMFGPGTGSFFALAGVSFRGQNLISSTAIAKTLNFATNIASLFVFLIAGKVIWLVGCVMMLGQFVGAWAGSLCLLTINPKYLRMVVVVMCVGMLSKYVYSMGWVSV